MNINDFILAGKLAGSGGGGGGGGGSSDKVIGLLETYDEETFMVSLPLTWRQIKDNFENKIYMIIYGAGSDAAYPYLDYIRSVTDDGHGGYAVESYNGMNYFTDDENGYPAYED